MSGIGNEDAFLAALRDAPARPVKRKAKVVLGGPSKRQSTSVPIPNPSLGTQQPSRRTAGAASNPAAKATVDPRPDSGKKKVGDADAGPLRSTEKSETEALVPYMEIMGPSMKEALGAALTTKMPPDVFDVVINARDYCAKLMSAIALLSSAMADVSNVSPDVLKEFMSKVTVDAEVPKQTHDAEIHRVEEDYESRLRALRAQMTEAMTQVTEKDQRLAVVSDKLSKVEAAAEKRINRLTDVRADLEKKLSECRTELEALKAKHEEYKVFLQTEMPGAKRRAYRECMTAMLKKIRHTYPEANMAYFADDSDAPDVELDPELLAPYDDTETAMDDDHDEDGEKDGKEAVTAEIADVVDIEK